MRYAALVLLSLSAACGPTVGANYVPQQVQTPPAQPSYATRDFERRRLLNDFASLSPTTSLPLSGNLNYQGQLNASLGAQQGVIGGLDINVDLWRDTVTGRAGNFVDRFNRPVAGGLEVFNGTVDITASPDQYQSTAGIRGRLVEQTGRTHDISGRLDGDLLGTTARGYEAVLTGSVKTNGGPQQPIKGGAVAQR